MLSIFPVVALNLCGAFPSFMREIFDASYVEELFNASFFQYLDLTVPQDGVLPLLVKLFIGSPTFQPVFTTALALPATVALIALAGALVVAIALVRRRA